MADRPIVDALSQRLRWNTERVYTGQGWDALLTELDELLSTISPDYKLYQVKEKFGTLRFYADFVECGDRRGDVWGRIFDSIIHAYEGRSANICEECGNWGNLKKKKYMFRTLCLPDAIRLGFETGDEDQAGSGLVVTGENGVEYQVSNPNKESVQNEQDD